MAPPKPPPQQSQLFATHRWLEEDLASQQIHSIVGVDEAGRGPLAGPVVAAAVSLPQGTYLPELDDSKRLQEHQRDALFGQVHSLALAVGVGVVCAREVDELNILQATFKAMRLAIARVRDSLPEDPQQIWIDGNRKFDYDLPLKTIVQGDHLSHNIAAASIIAKVTRDRLMLAYDDLYPVYQFASHKGYPSPAHREALKEHGPSPVHRFSFRGVKPQEPDTEAPDHDEEELL